MRTRKILIGAGLAAAVAALSSAALPAAATARVAVQSPDPTVSPTGSQRLAGIVTGVVLGAGGAPLAGVCVTASGPAGSAAAMTSPSGRYFLAGLATGAYSLRYRKCAHPGRYVAQWSAGTQRTGVAGLPAGVALPGGVGLPGQTSPAVAGTRIMITGGQLTRLAPVSLRSASQPLMGASGRPAVRPRTFAQLRRGTAKAGEGGISGRVTDAAGRPLKDICVTVDYGGFAIGGRTSRSGVFSSGPYLPAGHPVVQFSATCFGQSPSAGNWAPQWYKDKFSQAAANKITIRAGQTTKGISAVMRRGGQITGVVRRPSGARLSGVCVDVLTANGQRFVTQVKTVMGSYRADALDPGGYRVLFDPACGYGRTPYLAQWWRDAPNLKASNPVRVQFATVTRHVGATLALGGKITGIVRFRNRSGRPLRGMCVFVDGSSALGPVSTSASTARDGSYLIEGLPTGRYSLAFGPGCGSNGNLLYQNYGHLVSVTAGATKRIDAFLQPGGILSGTVTSAAGGTPLHGICVGIGSLGDFTSTRSDGTYSMDQLPPGRYAVSFVGGCGSAGSYAPQWYPGRARSFYAARVTITAAKDTSGIDAAMKPGATISGTVTTRSGYKVSEVCVGALDPGTASAFGELGDTLSRDGSYRIANLAPGQYQVVFFWCGVGAGYAPQWFRSAPGPGRAALVDLPRAATVTGIDAVLRPAGAITGTLSDSAGNPIQFACVSVINRRAGGFSELYDLVIGGGYFIGGLPPGSYDVQFIDCGGVGYATQWYSGKALQRTANPVFVTARHVTKGIDAVLTTKTGSGSISGRVTAKATGRPVRGACAVAYRNGLYAFATTSDNGDYTIKGLSSGSYHVSFSGCRRSDPYADATRPGLVRVISPGKVTGIDEALVLAGSISGAVLGGLPTPVAEPGICVDVVAAADGALVAFAETGLGGRYLVGHLAPGTYQVYFGDPFCPGGTEGLVPQWYDGKHTRAAATSVVVQPGKASVGVGATLLADGTIAGTVTGPAPASTPLTGICVIARPLNGTSPVYAVSDGGGYSLTGVRPGRYQVEFQSGCGATGYAAQWWNGASSAAGATVITVAPGAVTAGISAAMQG